MSIFDYLMPHRLFINNSLRKQSDVLKNRIASYQAEYENKLQLCRIEIYSKQQEKNKEYEEAKKKVISDLNKTKSNLDNLGKKLKQYVDEYLQRQYLYEMLKLINTEMDVVNEDFCFLKEQKSLLEDEIDIFKERKIQLLEIADVEDIIQLANNSGCEFGFNLEDNARTLLDKINEAIECMDNEHSIELYSLKKLRIIVQERVEYLQLIKYMDFLIKQKIQAINAIREKMELIKVNQRKIKLQRNDILYKINILNERLINLAKKIKYCLGNPISSLSDDINDNRRERDKIKDKMQKKFDNIEGIQNELRFLAEVHSNNQYRWNYLKNRKSYIKSDIDILKDRLSKINEKIIQQIKERDFWFKNMDNIYTSLSNNNIYLLSDKIKEDC